MCLERDLMTWARFVKRLDSVCPNKIPSRWYECDVMGITRTQLWHEFEVKRTMGDFRADFFKGPTRGGLGKHEVLKHKFNRTTPTFQNNPKGRFNRIAWADNSPPNYFWFCVVKDIADKVGKELPKYAGLLIYDPDKLKSTTGRFHVAQTAPRLHRDKVPPGS